MKMKKIVFYLLLVTCIASSCENFLTEEPKGRTTPDMLFKDEAGLDMAMTGVFNRFMACHNTLERFIHIFCADDITARNAANKARYAEFDMFNFNSMNDPLNAMWGSFYEAIKACNNIINNAEDMTINQTFLEHRLGQAYYLRAMSYFDLVRLWGRVPLVLEVGIDYTRPRASVEEIYELIESDLEKAAAMLPVNHTVAPYFRNGINLAPGQGAVKALQASVWMTQAGWPLKRGAAYYDKAAAKYKEIIDNEALYGYELTPDIRTLTEHPAGDYVKEIVFGVFLNPTPGSWTNTFASVLSEFPESGGGWGDIVAELEFYYSFPDGRRKDAFFMHKVRVEDGSCLDWWDKTTLLRHPYFKKNIHINGWDYNYDTGNYTDAVVAAMTSGTTRYIFRYADILLLYAEAVAFGSGAISDGVVDCVLRVQNRAEVPDDRKVTYGMSKQDFQKAVLDERRWETCGFEGSSMGRFYTMQRHEILHLQGEYRMVDPLNPDPHDKDNPNLTDTALNPTLSLNEKFYYMPIPDRELQRVPDLEKR